LFVRLVPVCTTSSYISFSWFAARSPVKLIHFHSCSTLQRRRSEPAIKIASSAAVVVAEVFPSSTPQTLSSVSPSPPPSVSTPPFHFPSSLLFLPISHTLPVHTLVSWSLLSFLRSRPHPKCVPTNKRSERLREGMREKKERRVEDDWKS